MKIYFADAGQVSSRVCPGCIGCTIRVNTMHVDMSHVYSKNYNKKKKHKIRMRRKQPS